MQVRARDGEAIRAGEITVLFRRWRRPQVVAGRVYRTAGGRIEVTDVREVDPARISLTDARAAGCEDPDGVRAALQGDPSATVYRLEVRPALDEDPRTVLARDDALSDEDRAEIDRRLARLDRASPRGPWTAETLALIASRPAERAADLAASVGRERDPFKLDVRKLKALGLTESLEVGYRLSPRGQAYVEGRSDLAVAGDT